jgi:hypothetical protein
MFSLYASYDVGKFNKYNFYINNHKNIILIKEYVRADF